MGINLSYYLIDFRYCVAFALYRLLYKYLFKFRQRCFSEQVNPSNHEPTNDYSVIVVEKIGEPFGFQISYNLERRPGVSINKIVEGGPADQAGLISGDHILSINDIELNS